MIVLMLLFRQEQCKAETSAGVCDLCELQHVGATHRMDVFCRLYGVLLDDTVKGSRSWVEKCLPLPDVWQ